MSQTDRSATTFEKAESVMYTRYTRCKIREKRENVKNRMSVNVIYGLYPKPSSTPAISLNKKIKLNLQTP